MHLLQRSDHSRGRLIQFTDNSVSDSKLSSLLQERVWQGKGAVIFEEDATLLEEFRSYLDLIEAPKLITTARDQSRRHLLQAMLFDLLSLKSEQDAVSSIHSDFLQFLKLVDEHYHTEHSVSFFLSNLHVSEKSLGSLSKSTWA